MKERTKGFLSGVLSTVIVLSLATGVYAASGGSVSFNSVNFKVNGVQVASKGDEMTLWNGESVPTSIFYTDAKGGGTTYLPVAKIAQLLGVKTGWDNDTQSVLIGEQKPEGEPLDESLSYQDIDIKLVKIGGKYYSLSGDGDVPRIGIRYVAAKNGDETLLFADDISVMWASPYGTNKSECIPNAGSMLYAMHLATCKDYKLTDTQNPYIDGAVKHEHSQLGFQGIQCGEGETYYISAEKTYTPVWYEYNGERIYRLSPEQNGTGTYDGIRYYEYHICVNDVMSRWGIDKQFEVGQYEGIWYIEIK